MALTTEQIAAIVGGNVIDANGKKLGRVGEIYLDILTQQAKWVTIAIGLFGLSQSVVPLSGASVAGSNLIVS